MQHLQTRVSELVESQSCVHEVDTIDHVGGHVYGAEAAG